MAETLIEAAGLLVLPRLKVQNANAISGPLTWGFPAPTAFTGFAHALERRLSDYLPEGFGGVGIICHDFQPQISTPAGRRTHVFNLTRNPVGKDGGAPALVEEGRAHLEVTLLIAVRDEIVDSDGQRLAQIAFDHVLGMRLAGGSILPPPPGKRYEPYWQTLPEYLDGQRETFQKLRRRLLPGFALVQRDDLLHDHLADMQTKAPANALDALLDLCRLNIEPGEVQPDDPDKVEWYIRKRQGWLVPLPTGYVGISELYPPGEVANARDPSTPFRFVEALYSLGQWVSPHRLDNLQALLWHTEADTETGIYRCVNRYTEALSQ
jgi:CRISPR-associated protein Csy2